VTADPAGAVSRSKVEVSVAFVHQLLAWIITFPASPGRWLSNLVDEADEIWELADDDDHRVHLDAWMIEHGHPSH
jgi:hypothetical protein